MSEHGKRIGDVEREQFSQTLRTAYAQGRITDSELEERIQAVFDSKTEEELLPIVADLPTDMLPEKVKDPVESQAAPLERAEGNLDVARLLAMYFPAILCTAIWAMTGFGYFWPMWVFFGLSIPVLRTLLASRNRDD